MTASPVRVKVIVYPTNLIRFLLMGLRLGWRGGLVEAERPSFFNTNAGIEDFVVAGSFWVDTRILKSFLGHVQCYVEEEK